MGSFQLKASANPLFVINPTEIKTTEVKYEAPQRIFLWRRINAGAWTKENLIEDAKSAEQAAELETRGSRTTPGLKAGNFVEYAMTRDNISPGAPGFERSLAYLLIDVLHTSTTLVAAGSDDNVFLGGTYVGKRVTTGVKTRLRMQVGREPAVGPTNGFRRLPNPIAEVFSELKGVHETFAEPLVSGTAHILWSLLISETGEWQIIEEPFKTKRRKVTIQFKNFRVVNDGDENPWGEGDEVEIWFRVYNGDAMVNEFKWGPGQISDLAGANDVGLNFSDAVIGPDNLDGVDPGVGLGIYALERDYFFWGPSTDEAQYERGGSKIKRFDFPNGRDDELVLPPSTDTNFDITAKPMNDDGELQLTANVRYVVRYE